MTSLPERLRSLVARNAIQREMAEGLTEAADELDRRAEEIQRLGYKLRRVGELVGPPGAWPHTPDLEEVERNENPETRYEGVTLTEDPTKTPEYVEAQEETPSEYVEDATVREALDVLLTRVIEAARKRWYA